MRRAALLGLLLLLPSCSSDIGFSDFLSDTFTVRRNVNAPIGDSETLRRIRDLPVDVPPLTVEPGDVWPGPIQSPPTLEDLERQQGTPGQAELPVPGSPAFRATPGNGAPAVPNQPAPGGGVLQTPRGPAAPTGNQSPNFQQYKGTPGGSPGGILIPNGNGTSTLVHPDGTVETVPTPGK
jgi:hypothetical protein